MRGGSLGSQAPVRAAARVTYCSLLDAVRRWTHVAETRRSPGSFFASSSANNTISQREARRTVRSSTSLSLCLSLEFSHRGRGTRRMLHHRFHFLVFLQGGFSSRNFSRANMAGSYTKKEFGAGPEEQTLLKDSNGTRIVPVKGNGNSGILQVFSSLSEVGSPLSLCLFLSSAFVHVSHRLSRSLVGRDFLFPLLILLLCFIFFFYGYLSYSW